MKLNVDELRLLPKQRRIIEFKEVLKGLPTTKPVVGELVANASASGVQVTGNLKTLLKLECDRCLKPYFQSIKVDVDERFVAGDLWGDPGRERELRRDDFVETLPESGVIDITDIVYQAVTLATPSCRLCGVDCPGMPQAPAVLGLPDRASLRKRKSGGVPDHRPADPRWENLKTLFPKNDSQ